MDAVHTLDFPAGNATQDSEINRLSIEEQRVVVTKDDDFVQSFILQGRPYKLLLVNAGNITNQELLALFEARLPELATFFENSSFVEMTRDFLVIHK
jgi:predicted nuclease of predicted toxin-antitoxin system